MKKSIPALSFALAVACALLGAAVPAAAQEKAEVAAPAAPARQWSGAALIPALASADCAAELVAAGSDEPTGIPVCGVCSQEGCAHAEVGSTCGSSGGEFKFCIDELEYCRHSGPKCSCRLGPI